VFIIIEPETAEPFVLISGLNIHEMRNVRRPQKQRTKTAVKGRNINSFSILEL
jgi:hypothetical protein